MDLCVICNESEAHWFPQCYICKKGVCRECYEKYKKLSREIYLEHFKTCEWCIKDYEKFCDDCKEQTLGEIEWDKKMGYTSKYMFSGNIQEYVIEHNLDCNCKLIENGKDNYHCMNEAGKKAKEQLNMKFDCHETGRGGAGYAVNICKECYTNEYGEEPTEETTVITF